MASSKEKTHEFDICLNDGEFDGLQAAIQATKWMELPFREAAIILEEQWDRSKNDEEKLAGTSLRGRDYYFMGSLILQCTDEHRRQLPMTKVLGLLSHLECERDLGKRGQAWFDSTARNLFTVIKGLPSEHEAAFIALLRAVTPGVDDTISSMARKGANARHKKNRAKKDAFLSEWDKSGHEYKSRADFARIVGKVLEIEEKERTLCTWIAEREKAKA